MAPGAGDPARDHEPRVPGPARRDRRSWARPALRLTRAWADHPVAAPRACPDQDRPGLEADDAQRATCGPAPASPARTRRSAAWPGPHPHGCARTASGPPRSPPTGYRGTSRSSWTATAAGPQQRGLPRPEGHRAGIEAVHDVVHGALEIGLSHLTLYAFSTENWKRDTGEVIRLFAMLDEELRSAPDLDHGVRLRWLGYPDRLPWELVQTLRDNETASRDQRTLTLTLCVNYGGRAEILHGAAAVARSVLAGDLDPEQITEGEFARRLPLPDLPDVDLLWRTGAEQRTSNFLPWHSTYAELFFTTSLWPDVVTAATCGTPSPNTRDGDAVTARPSADLSANVGVRRVIAGLPGPDHGRRFQLAGHGPVRPRQHGPPPRRARP